MNKLETPEAQLARGKEMVAEVIAAIGGMLSSWKPSRPGVIGLWEYADLAFGETVLRIGVSGGGVVSINGHPFDPDGQVNLTNESVQKALSAQYRNILVRRVAVVLQSASPFLKPGGSAGSHSDIALSLEDLDLLGIDEAMIDKALPASFHLFPSAMAYAEFVERTQLLLLEQHGESFWGSELQYSFANLVCQLMDESGIDPEDDEDGYCLKATASEICRFNLARIAKYLIDPSASYTANNPSAKQAEEAGYRVERGGDAAGDRAGQWVWSVRRPEGDVKTSNGNFPTEGDAWKDAVRALRSE